MSSSFLTKDLLEPAIRRVQNDDTIIVEEIKISKPDLTGAHFVSAVDTAEVKISSQKPNSDKTINLFVKRLAQSDLQANIMKDINFFQRESDIFNQIIPEMLKFSNLYGVGLEEILPVCYFASGEETKQTIILEDLSIQGYKMVPFISTELQDINHVTLAIRAIAKIHAVSYCMKEFTNFPEKYPYALKELVFTDPENKLLHILKSMWRVPLVLFDESTKMRKNLEKFYDRGFDRLVALMQPNEPFNVLNHGDFWSNNMLFKYGDDGKPISIKLVDWQICKFNSLAYDLAYYFYTSTTAQFRKDHLTEMLTEYYSEFKDVAKKLGVDKLAFTFDEMCAEYMSKRFAGYITVHSGLTVGLVPKSENEFTDPDDAGGPGFEEGFAMAYKKVMSNPQTKELVVKIITDVYHELEQMIDEL